MQNAADDGSKEHFKREQSRRFDRERHVMSCDTNFTLFQWDLFIELCIPFSFAVLAMSLLLESEAQFTARAREIGLSPDAIQAIKDAGANPQDVDGFLRNALGRDPSLAENAHVRRLAFEAQTLLVASLRQVIDSKDDGAPKRIGAAERETRMASTRAELGGLTIADENEPSHMLSEKACQIHETNTLKYLEPSACTSRSQEVQGSSKTKELVFEGGSW